MTETKTDSSLHNFVGRVVGFLDVSHGYACGASSLPPRSALNNRVLHQICRERFQTVPYRWANNSVLWSCIIKYLVIDKICFDNSKN